MSETITPAAPAAGAPAAAPAAPAPAAPAAAPAGEKPAGGAPADTGTDTVVTASVLTDAPAQPEGDATKGDTPKGDAPKGDAPKEPAAPVEYTDFELPEGLAKDNATLAAFCEEAGKLGLTQDQAQAIIGKVGGQIAEAANAAAQAWVKTNEGWQAEIKADPEIGGDHFEPMRLNVARLMDDYAGAPNTPERKALNQALLLTGAGNNPAIVRFIARLAAAHTEGGHVAGAPARQQTNPADLLYPTHNQAPGAR